MNKPIWLVVSRHVTHEEYPIDMTIVDSAHKSEKAAKNAQRRFGGEYIVRIADPNSDFVAGEILSTS